MVTVEQLSQLAADHPGRQFCVHNGYLGWSYGAPQNPIPITLQTALNLLSGVCERGGDLAILDAIANDLVQYAADGDALFHRTNGNRFVQLVDFAICAIEPGREIETPVSFALGMNDAT